KSSKAPAQNGPVANSLFETSVTAGDDSYSQVVRSCLFMCGCPANQFLRFSSGFALRGNIINHSRAHEVLATGRWHNLFFDAQMIEQHQNFKQSFGIFVFQICRASSLWYDKAQEGIKFQLPFDCKPALKHRDDLAGSNGLEWRAKMPRLGAFNLRD